MNSIKAIVFLMLITMISFGLFIGCGSELNPDYEEVEGGYHQFGGLRHSQYMNSDEATFSECTECHGADLRGVNSGSGGEAIRSCYTCHNSLNHMSGFDTYGEHDNYLQSNHWDINECYLCHTATTTSDFSFGGSCSSAACHGISTEGPEACFTCHGDFTGQKSAELRNAPPTGLEDELLTSTRAVGAHEAHLAADANFAAISCDECHIVPSAVNDAGHLDSENSEAEIVFGDISGDGEYDVATGTCSSTDCHGSSEPVWTQVDGTFSACGSCHNYPEAPESHDPDSTNCSQCHGNVIDAEGNIIDPDKHVNGRKG